MPLLDLTLKEKFCRDSDVSHQYFFAPKDMKTQGSEM